MRAENLVLKKDRVTLTFHDGMLYFPPPVEGKVRGAVFWGRALSSGRASESRIRARQRAAAVEGGQSRARISRRQYCGSPTIPIRFWERAPNKARLRLRPRPNLQRNWSAEVLEETGANLSARQMMSILNQESPGFFFAEVAEGIGAFCLCTGSAVSGFR